MTREHRDGATPMHLFLPSDKIIANPTDEEIAAALPLEQYAVMSTGPDDASYLQFALPVEPTLEPFLDYKVESSNCHFRAAPHFVVDKVVRAFQLYARGDDSWKADFEWRRLEPSERI